MYYRKAIFSILTVVFLLSGLGAGSVPALAQPARSPVSEASLRLPAIPINSVPVEFTRKALNLIAEVRSDKTMAPNWANATINPDVRELYRPGVKGVAYYEFRILINKEPAGFIIVSTGRHDFPIPHWNNVGLSPTAELDQQAAKQQLTIVTYYKLDALTYAGEDAKGQFVSNSDNLVKITGIDPAVLKDPITVSQLGFAPPAGISEDKPGSNKDLWTETQAGPLSAQYEFSPWASFEEMKAGYAATYAAFLQKLSMDAAPDWDIETFANEFGEVLSKGDVRNIDLLCAAPEISATGSAVDKKMVTLSTVDRSASGLLPTYNIVVDQDEFMVDNPLNISMTCPGALPETFKFVVTSRVYRTFLSTVSNGSSGTAVAPSAVPVDIAAASSRTLQSDSASGRVEARSVPTMLGDWGPWSYYWVWNGTGDVSNYQQWMTATCYTGCGATAWAMLFGWADYEAASWSYWAPRFGIYRENGGYGVNVVAPKVQDVGIQNITGEILGYIHTFCWGSSGATTPWDMGQAWRYLAGRSGTRVDTHYNVLGITEDRLRDYAVRSIRDRKTPAIIGTGWLSHYPLAMGYAWRSRTVRACAICWWDTTEYSRWFWVNQGWGGSGNGWVSADTWFAGEIYP